MRSYHQSWGCQNCVYLNIIHPQVLTSWWKKKTWLETANKTLCCQQTSGFWTMNILRAWVIDEQFYLIHLLVAIHTILIKACTQVGSRRVLYWCLLRPGYRKKIIWLSHHYCSQIIYFWMNALTMFHKETYFFINLRF